MFDAAVETLPWGEQVLLDDQLYRQQIEYVLAHSRFYGDKLGSAGFTSAAKIGGLGDIARLPFTEKSEIRASRSDDNPIGSHLCVARSDIVRIYSTSGTTGAGYIPLTVADLDNWVTTSARSYAAAGIKRGEGIVTTYNAGPFVAGAALAAFDQLGLPPYSGRHRQGERLMTAIKLLKPKAAVMTPSLCGPSGGVGGDAEIRSQGIRV
jgi:phenylacetate-CoA ligase